MATKKKNSERFITERITPAGSHLLRIQIRAYDQTFSKNIAISDFGTRKQAMEFAKQVRDDALVKMRQGYTVSNFKTVEEIYKKTFDLFPVRVKTVRRHDIFYKHGIAQYGDMSIDKVTSADIQTSINAYARTHTKRQVQGLLAIWKRIFKTAVMMNISIPDRTVPVVIPECYQGTPRKKEISADDLETFCDTLLSYNQASVTGQYMSRSIYYAIQIMKYCGLRPAEVFALTRDDFMLTPSGGYISVSKASHSTVSSVLEIGRTKTEKSVRLVPVPAELLPVLAECLQWSKHDIVFADIHGNLQDIDQVSDYVHRVSKKAKVDFNLYMLRHQLSTDLFSNGTPANVIRDIMGHESASMSLDYAVSNDSDRITAINSRSFALKN